LKEEKKQQRAAKQRAGVFVLPCLSLVLLLCVGVVGDDALPLLLLLLLS
jgi:hypothetical protein